MKNSLRTERGKVFVQKDVIIDNILKANALDISKNGMYISTQGDFLQGAVLE